MACIVQDNPPGLLLLVMLHLVRLKRQQPLPLAFPLGPPALAPKALAPQPLEPHPLVPALAASLLVASSQRGGKPEPGLSRQPGQRLPPTPHPPLSLWVSQMVSHLLVELGKLLHLPLKVSMTCVLLGLQCVRHLHPSASKCLHVCAAPLTSAGSTARTQVQVRVASHVCYQDSKKN